MDQNKLGRNRPAPSFVPVSVAAKEIEAQDDAVASNAAQQNTLQMDAGAHSNVQDEVQTAEPATTLPHPEQRDFTLSVEEILIRLRNSGIDKSKDSVQRYCREGTLDCQKLGLFRRYFATEISLTALIEKMRPDEDVRNCIQVHEAASTRDVLENNETGAGASNRVLVHPTEDEIDGAETPVSKTSSGENLVEFLKEEICVKNKQLEVKDTQIAAMLERDHETNILIRVLQNHLGDNAGWQGRHGSGK